MSDKVVAEVSHPTVCCPKPHLWSCYDSEGTEVEVVDFLSALVVMLKPEVLIETGCYKGYGTEQIARGVVANGFGEFYTTDVGMDMVETTQRRLASRYLQDHVQVVHGTGVQLIARMTKPVDFAFLDSGPDDIRTQELRALLPKLSASGVVVVHDTGIQHGLRAHFLTAVKELRLQYFMFDTPRGVSLVRKPWK